MGTELSIRDQASLSIRDQTSLFALMVVARPVTNRELRELAGVEITGEVRRHLERKPSLITATKQGAVNTFKLTPTGRTWCEESLSAGRPDGARFPAGVLYAVLGRVGHYLHRSGNKFDEFFRPDIENWIRAVYTELTVRRGPGTWVRLSKLRPWLEDLPRDVVDGELDRMIEQPDVQFMAELNQRSLTEADHKAAVDIGGEPRHLLKIGSA